jgi:hypothetical protein
MYGSSKNGMYTTKEKRLFYPFYDFDNNSPARFAFQLAFRTTRKRKKSFFLNIKFAIKCKTHKI